MKKKIVAILLVVVLAFGSVFALVACDNNKTNFVVNVGPEPGTIDPALNSAVDGATYIMHAFSGLMKWSPKADGSLEIVEDSAEEYTVSDDGKTYVFTLKDDLKFSNGDPLKASDFVWAWRRAVAAETGADYGYMFDVIDGYDVASSALDDGGDPTMLNAVADDEAGTITVTLKTRTPYFLELVAFPTYFPVHRDTVEAHPDDWATKPSTYIGNGPYKLAEWVHDSKLVFTKNENYHDAEAIKPQAIEFALTDDQNAMLNSFKTGDYLFVDDMPVNEIDAWKDKAEYHNVGQLGTYYYNWNINVDLSPKGGTTLTPAQQAEVRNALSMLIDRTNVVEIANGGQQEANSFVPIGLTEPDGKEFADNNGPDRDGKGYYSATDFDGNKAKAIAVLKKYYAWDEAKKAFTNVPTIEFLTNPGAHEDLAEAVQADWKGVGIEMKIVTQEWNVFLETRKAGDYTLARNGWLGDYNDPISFIDMWTTASGNNDVQFGKGDHATVDIYGAGGDKTWAETFDTLVAEIKAETDLQNRMDLMHDAEDLLMETGALMPVYYYTDLYLASEKLEGFFASPLGYKYFMYVDIPEEAV